MGSPFIERKCPACGDALVWNEDVLGETYQCTNLSCLELYEADEIDEPADQLQAKKEQAR